jgi:Polyketide cyclase / dehydrase and lipid transport
MVTRNAKQKGKTAPANPVGKSVRKLVGIAAKRVTSSLTDRMSATTDRLTAYADHVKDNIKETALDLTSGITGGSGSDGDRSDGRFKVTSIIEQIDVGAPIDLVYDQWTRFTDYPEFMKNVENVEQVSDEKLRWTVRVLRSHRTWESTIREQVARDRIVWTSEGAKGYVDGAVTFHELAPDLTRVVLVLEYHPRGLFERTGNLWRAQGRRARLELKNFQRHVMTQAVLHPDDIEGWHGEIHDGEVVEDEPKPKRTTRSRRGMPATKDKPTSTRRSRT